MGLPVRVVLAVVARAARRTVPPYPAIDDFATDDALAIGLAEAAAAGIPFDGRTRSENPEGRLVALVRLAEAVEGARAAGEGSAGEIDGARALRRSAIDLLSGILASGRAASFAIDGWAERCFNRDVLLARREAGVDGSSSTLGSALDAGTGRPFGPLWPWDLAPFDGPDQLTRSLLPRGRIEPGQVLPRGDVQDGPRVGDDGDLVPCYFGERLEAERAEVFVRSARLGRRGFFADVATYAEDYDAGVEERLADQGILVLTRESFPGEPPGNERAFVMLLAQSVAHARLGIGPHHSPLERPTLLQRAVAGRRGDPGDTPDDDLVVDEPSRSSDDDVLAWIAREFQDRPTPGSADGPVPSSEPAPGR